MTDHFWCIRSFKKLKKCMKKKILNFEIYLESGSVPFCLHNLCISLHAFPISKHIYLHLGEF